MRDLLESFDELITDSKEKYSERRNCHHVDDDFPMRFEITTDAIAHELSLYDMIAVYCQQMNQSILLLGRQPKLGLAELESLHGSDHVVPFGDGAALLDLSAEDILFARLGGSSKLARVITSLPTSNWRRIERELIKIAPDLPRAEGKFTLGLSIYGDITHLKDIQATALRLKKSIRTQDPNQSVRISQNKSASLSSAQVIHDGLTTAKGAELIVVRSGDAVIIGQTVAEQDIEAYAARDQGRPKRDARVGMLPPKLAQIIINLAAAETRPSTDLALLDPFCGTGVVLQEASLMGYGVYGTDLEPRMIDYTQKNLAWLSERTSLPALTPQLEQGDATTHVWEPAPEIVACEGYLGQPFSGFPTSEKLREVSHTCNQIMKGFLKNITGQLKPGTRLCIGLPAWRQRDGSFVHLNLLDSLEELGYNRISFVHVDAKDLLYYREDQFVARELLVITRK